MREKDVQKINKYIFWAVITILVILSYLIIKSFIISLVSAFILAYLTKPVFNYISPALGKKISALFCIILVIMIIILPLVAIASGIINQAEQSLTTELIKSTFKKISSYPLLQNLNLDISDLTKSGIEIIISLLKTSALALPRIILSIIITLIAIYFILIDWDNLAVNLNKYLPFKDKEKVRKDISRVTNFLVYGTLLIGLIEFVIAAIGFFIVGVKSYLFLSALIFLFAFIPALGPAAVWAPLAIYYLLVQNYPTAIGIIIIGLILSILIDGLLKIKLLGHKTNINPLVMLLGILGGIPLFGIFGFIIGPLILVYTIELIEELIKER